MKRVYGCVFFNSAQQMLSWTVNYSNHLCLQINNFKATFYIAIQTEFSKTENSKNEKIIEILLSLGQYKCPTS